MNCRTESPRAMLTAKEAAAQLSISARSMYDLAAPGGPVPCYRIGRAVRFAQEDLDRYLQALRCEPAGELRPRWPIVTLQASSPTGESSLMQFFRKQGVKVRTKTEVWADRARRRK